MHCLGHPHEPVRQLLVPHPLHHHPAHLPRLQSSRLLPLRGIYLFIYLYIYLIIYLSIHPSIYILIYIYIHIFIWIFVDLFANQPTIYLSIYWISSYLAIYLSRCTIIQWTLTKVFWINWDLELISTWILLNQKDPTGIDSAEGAHGRPPNLVLLL